MDAQRSGLDAFARPDGVGHTFGETSYFWTFHNPDGGGSPARNGVFALVSEQGKIGHAHLRPQDCFESKSCGRGSTSPIFPAMNMPISRSTLNPPTIVLRVDVGLAVLSNTACQLATMESVGHLRFGGHFSNRLSTLRRRRPLMEARIMEN